MKRCLANDVRCSSLQLETDRLVTAAENPSECSSQAAQLLEWRGAPQNLGGTELLYPFNKGGQAFSSVEGPGGSMDEGSCMQGSRGPRAIGNCPRLAAQCPDHLLCAWSAAPCCISLIGLWSCPPALIGSWMPLSLQCKHRNASRYAILCLSCSLMQAEMQFETA